ncbi:MAG: hypothetical protein UGF89_06480 [Acutalibacteraceae bacterium]|nr:hypothetical protein [Acutalibacteraceae bacterium]
MKNGFAKTFTVVLVALVVAFMAITCFAGCGNDTVKGSGEVYQASETTTEENRVGMERVGIAGGFTYYRDASTDVMYLWKQEWDTGGAGYAGLTIMMNPETGLPLTYADWVNFEEGEFCGTNENTESGS